MYRSAAVGLVALILLGLGCGAPAPANPAAGGANPPAPGSTTPAAGSNSGMCISIACAMAFSTITDGLPSPPSIWAR